MRRGISSFASRMSKKFAHLGDFCFHRWKTEVYQALHEQAVILDAREAAKGVPSPPADQKVTDGDVCPLSVHEIGQRLSPGAREELQSLKWMFAITFADKEGKKFVFQCKEDYEQMLLKEATQTKHTSLRM